MPRPLQPQINRIKGAVKEIVTRRPQLIVSIIKGNGDHTYKRIGRKLGLLDTDIPTPLAYYLYNIVNRRLDVEKLELILAEPGKILLKGKKLFHNILSRVWHEYILNLWKPIDYKHIALFTPCSKIKPIPKSFMNKKIDAILEKYGLDYYVERFIVSEPLGIIPYRYSLFFPAAHYDYPPQMVDSDELDTYINIVSRFLTQLASRYQYNAIIYFLPRWHRKVFEEALVEASIEAHYVPYNIYYLPKLLEALNNAMRTLITGRQAGHEENITRNVA